MSFWKDKVVLVTAFGPSIVANGMHAGKFLAPIAKLCGGGGGGRPNFAQAGGRESEALDHALDCAKNDLSEFLQKAYS